MKTPHNSSSGKQLPSKVATKEHLPSEHSQTPSDIYNKTSTPKNGNSKDSAHDNTNKTPLHNYLKLSAQRFRQSSPNTNASLSDLNRAFESDRGRVINSAAVRRLQQKTQVFPLEKNSAVRSRLTHSLEVMQVGRFIAQSICTASTQKNDAQKTGIGHTEYSLIDLIRPLETTVEMACMLHDVGNPPFGHFGEEAINTWFLTHAMALYKRQNTQTTTKEEQAIFNDMMHFEGNAQAIRLVHSLTNLNLTNSLVASILKYTRCGIESKPSKDQALSYLKKKVGYYFSEKTFVQSVQQSLGIQQGHRHPGAYIMEAADDISYCMADLEDAVEKGIIQIEKLQSLLIKEYAVLLTSFGISTANEESFDTFIKRDTQQACSFADVPTHLKMAYICHKAFAEYNKEDIKRESTFFVNFRVAIVHPLVEHAKTRFLDNIEQVTSGSLNEALLEDKSYQHALSKTLKNVALEHVFRVKEVETAELKGHQILHGLLDKFGVLLRLASNEFIELCRSGQKGNHKLPLESRLLKRIGAKHLATYVHAIEHIEDYQEANISPNALEYYFRCRLIQDHISGMTDQFALDEYTTLYAL